MGDVRNLNILLLLILQNKTRQSVPNIDGGKCFDDSGGVIITISFGIVLSGIIRFDLIYIHASSIHH